MKTTGSRKKNRLEIFLADLKEKIRARGTSAADETGISCEEFALLPLRDLVLFPHTLVPIFITYKPGIAALEEALRRDNRLFAACLTKRETGAQDETLTAGTVMRIIQHLHLPGNGFRVVLQGEYRAAICGMEKQDSFTVVKVAPVPADGFCDPPLPEETALLRSVQKAFAQYAELSKKINTDTISAVERAEDPERTANLICNAMAIKPEKKLALLGIAGTRERLAAVLEMLELENEISGIQKNISGKIKGRLYKRQREYLLHEQLKEINRELGEGKSEDEFSELERAIAAKEPPAEVLAKTAKEILRLRKLQPFSPEAGVLRGYLEWIADLPWKDADAASDLNDLQAAQTILDEDHFGMKKVKERIIEFIAVRKLLAAAAPPQSPAENETAAGMGALCDTQDASAGDDQAAADSGAAIKGPILCFVGPPGTGKTSLGKSIARALGRRFVRISLGGVRDEAEIRGHRKTYVGALPGRIIQSLRRAGAVNPVFLLDEIDKLSSDFRGDPAAALLEVLDPEQNATFIDHYLEVPFDLSKVLFITTANSLHEIPYPLLDRMEIIEVPGYGENEKLVIARQFLLPKALRENGLEKAKITFSDDALRDIIRCWTMESGVRGLEREIARCVRKIARRAVEKKYGACAEKPVESFQKNVKRAGLQKLLGRKKYQNDLVFKEARTGVTYGLAWTESGGAMLPVETVRYPGSGELVITGNLGDVMKESARIALSYLCSAQGRYGFQQKDIAKTNFHIHVPAGAIPKDGPSAGITLASSLLSTLCKIPPRPGIAMTGELTLTGRILPIGGLKEKLLAAIRCGMEKVLLPADNRAEWEELDREIRAALAVSFVETADEAFALLFDGEISQKKITAHE